MTPAGIEPTAFRFVAQHLNHCATAVTIACNTSCFSTATVVTRTCLSVARTSPVFLWIKNVRGVRGGAAAREVENHLSIITKAEERKQDVSRWPWGLKGNNLKVLFFPLISESWKTIALFEGSQASPAFPVVWWRWVCSIGGMILTGENLFETEMLLSQYVHIRLQVLPHTQAPPQLRRSVAGAQRCTKHVHRQWYCTYDLHVCTVHQW